MSEPTSGLESPTAMARLIRVVGEFTTSGGPWSEDHFFVFVLSDLRTCELPNPAGWLAATKVAAELGFEPQCQLANRTDFTSIVMWPPELAGRPLFDFQPVKRGHGLWARLRDATAPLVGHDLTAEVKRYVQCGTEQFRPANTHKDACG